LDNASLLTSWDIALLMSPFFAMLAAWMFGLDRLLAAPRRRSHRRSFAQADQDGRLVFTDPDGRPWKMRFRAHPFPNLRTETVEKLTLEGRA
jgi:hypothetical protein